MTIYFFKLITFPRGRNPYIEREIKAYIYRIPNVNFVRNEVMYKIRTFYSIQNFLACKSQQKQ